jgi:hypothetical protein
VRIFNRRLAALALVTALASACEPFEPTAPFPGSLAIQTSAGDHQQSLPGSELADDLRVRVIHSATGDPVEGIAIAWIVVAGTGIELISPAWSTDAQGFASVRVRLGDGLGSYVLEARFPGLRSEPARFTLFAVSAAGSVHVPIR